MDVTVRSLTKVSESEWALNLAAGESSLDSQLVTQDVDGMAGFNISDPAINELLTLCGLNCQFSENFFSFMENGTPELPWEFGSQDDETVLRVCKRHKS